MSGGSKKKKMEQEAQEMAAASATVTPQSMPSPIPGHMGMLAQQLSAGGYGEPTSIRQALEQTYAAPSDQWGWFYDIANSDADKKSSGKKSRRDYDDYD